MFICRFAAEFNVMCFNVDTAASFLCTSLPIKYEAIVFQMKFTDYQWL